MKQAKAAAKANPGPRPTSQAPKTIQTGRQMATGKMHAEQSKAEQEATSSKWGRVRRCPAASCREVGLLQEPVLLQWHCWPTQARQGRWLLHTN